MNTVERQTFRPSAARLPANAIDWEELPSFAYSPRQRLELPGRQLLADEADQDGWAETQAGALNEPPADTAWFRSPISGLLTRELHEPELLRHLFA